MWGYSRVPVRIQVRSAHSYINKFKFSLVRANTASNSIAIAPAPVSTQSQARHFVARVAIFIARACAPVVLPATLRHARLDTTKVVATVRAEHLCTQRDSTLSTNAHGSL